MKKAQGLIEYAIGIAILVTVSFACISALNNSTAKAGDALPAYMESFQRQ